MARYEFDLAIIGTGSAGMTAARFAASIGLRVVAIERGRVGGDCLWTGCVPSKALLAAAKAAQTMREAAKHGLSPVEPEIDLDRVMAEVRAVQDRIARGEDAPERFEAMGVELRSGTARVVGPHLLMVDRKPLTAKTILVATGGRPVLPPIPGLEDPLTTESLWEADPAPRSLVVVGGGPIAIELAQAFTRLGAPVTVLERADRVLPRDEPALVDRLVAGLRAEGVELHTGAEVVRAERGAVVARVGGEERRFKADRVLVAAGRRPNVEGLGLEDLGIAIGDHGVLVDDALRTSVPSIYAAGDVIGGPQFTHSAGFEAARAVRNAVFPARATGDYGVPWCTFTDPELAHAGLIEAEARERHGDVEVHVHDLEASDRAQAERATGGELRLVTARGRLVGAHLLSPGAGETIHELALAIERGLSLADLAAVVHVYPTIATGVQQLAAQAVYARAARLRRVLPGV
jgi:pyruvate/2-oxoglutarate dehydrogenase complex dihydrolipoamide dehydrogenase (E3) component